MPAWLKFLGSSIRWIAAGVLTLLCWSLWLALGALLVAQLAIALTHEFQVPRFVLQSIEERFTASHIHASFGRATFDPTGGVLLENLRLSLPEFAEPVIDVRAVYIELDPWALLLGKLEARRVHATGATLFVPAMLTPSGRSEQILSDLEFEVSSHDRELEIQQLIARVAGVEVTAHGSFHLQQPPKGTTIALPLLENLSGHYAALSRQLIRVAQRLQGFERPAIQATLLPSPSRGAIASLVVSARQVDLTLPVALHAQEVRIQTRVPLLGDAPALSPLTASADTIETNGIIAHRLEVWARGLLIPSSFFYTPREAKLAAGDVSTRGFTLEHVAALLQPNPLPQVDVQGMAEFGGSGIVVAGHADLAAKNASLRVAGAVSPHLLKPISTALHRDVRRFVDFGQPVEVALRATFGPGWAFTEVDGHVAARDIEAYHVHLDSAQGDIRFDGRHFLAHHATAILGEDIAHGSFEQDLKTRQFRFLLEGRLRPLDIKGWFHPWWPNFFGNFEFPDSPPEASVDVAGWWFSGGRTTVFVFAQSEAPVIRGAKLDFARTRMFIRPNFFDGLETFVTRGAGEARGTFVLTRALTPSEDDETGNELRFDVASTLDLSTGAQLLGPALATQLDPFAFDQPPQVKASGRIETGAERPGHHLLHLDVHSTGGFSAYRFKGQRLAFEATLRDDNLLIDSFEAGVGGGVLSGHAQVSGADSHRRLGFDAFLRDANLGEAVGAAADFVATRQGKKRGSADAFLTNKTDAKLEGAVSAEGLLEDPYSFKGTGNASLSGTQLGEVRLLGLLSQLLNFTALRFTAARADFKLEGAKIDFPTVTVTGANSAIHAHGSYALDQHALDFNARVYPFQESKSLLQSVVGAVLTPVSAVLEVKLTGSLDQPKWAFVIGPTNLFRSLTPPEKPAETAKKTAEPSPYLKREP